VRGGPEHDAALCAVEAAAFAAAADVSGFINDCGASEVDFSVVEVAAGHADCEGAEEEHEEACATAEGDQVEGEENPHDCEVADVSVNVEMVRLDNVSIDVVALRELLHTETEINN
jgi:hypothetical protein